MKKETEQKINKLIKESLKKVLKEYGEDSGAQDLHWGMYKEKPKNLKGTNQDFIDKGKDDYYDGISIDKSPYDNGKNPFYKVDLSKLWKLGWKQAEAEDKGIEFNDEEEKDLEDDNQEDDYKDVNLTESQKTESKRKMSELVRKGQEELEKVKQLMRDKGYEI